jgi:hypothetical protein
MEDSEMAGLKCVNCGSTNWVTDHVRGDEICDDCGAVQDSCMLMGSMFENRTIVVDSHFSRLPSTTLDLPAPALHGGNDARQQGGGKKKKVKTLADAHQKLATVSASLTDRHLELYFSEIRKFVTLLDLIGRVEVTAKDIITQYEKCKGNHRRILGKGTVGVLPYVDPSPSGPPAFVFSHFFFR